MSCHVMSCHVMSCHVMSCHVMSCHVMSCHVMSCHVMSCHVMSSEAKNDVICLVPYFKLAIEVSFLISFLFHTPSIKDPKNFIPQQISFKKFHTPVGSLLPQSQSNLMTAPLSSEDYYKKSRMMILGLAGLFFCENEQAKTKWIIVCSEENTWMLSDSG